MTEEKRPVGRPRKEPNLDRIQIAAQILGGIAANGAGRVRPSVMVETAIELADALLERAK